MQFVTHMITIDRCQFVHFNLYAQKMHLQLCRICFIYQLLNNNNWSPVQVVLGFFTWVVGVTKDTCCQPFIVQTKTLDERPSDLHFKEIFFFSNPSCEVVKSIHKVESCRFLFCDSWQLCLTTDVLWWTDKRVTVRMGWHHCIKAPLEDLLNIL